MTPLLVAGGCGLFAILACLISAGVGGWWYYSKGEKDRVAEVEKDRAVQDRRANKSASLDKLKQIGLAVHSFHDMNKWFPRARYNRDNPNGPAFSWRVAILPFVDEGPMFNAIRFDEAWDSPHNRQFANKTPKAFQLPGKPNDGKTYYQVFRGQETPFPDNGQISFFHITDGTSNTLMVVEAAQPVDWMRPDDIPFQMGERDLLKRVGNHWDDDTFQVVLCDGVARSMRRTIPTLTLQAFITRNGGEVNVGDW